MTQQKRCSKVFSSGKTSKLGSVKEKKEEEPPDIPISCTPALVQPQLFLLVQKLPMGHTYVMSYGPS